MNYYGLKKAIEGKGLRFFNSGSFNLNLIGVRTTDDGANTFNDLFYIAFRDGTGVARALGFNITTDPGTDYRVNPLNEKGTGIIAPGQHRGAWAIGKHKGEPALVQVKPMAVFRDNDKNDVLDFDPSTVESVLGGFNCHKASKTGTSLTVGKWSAGCQVFANCHDHDVLLALCERAASLYGNSFTYTLITSDDLPD